MLLPFPPTNCSDGQYINNGTCTACRSCAAAHKRDHTCDGTHDSDSCSLAWWVWLLVALAIVGALVLVYWATVGFGGDEATGGAGAGDTGGLRPRGFRTVELSRL